MVQVFRDVRRVLRDDGTLWLNLGDSYANDGKWGGHTGGKHARALHAAPIGRNKRYTGLKPKDLIGIPWLIAFALREDGWYLRMDTVWHKPNVMPENVADRPTRAHEYLFLLAKSARYYYDAQAIKEPVSVNTHSRGHGVNPKAAGKNEQTGDRKTHGFNERWRVKQNASFSGAISGRVEMRNKRSVWSVMTQPCELAHFATFPEDLVAPCVLAGSRLGDWVLDPFLGSGTTARVAISLGRRAIGCDLQRDYLPLQRERMTVTRGLPLEIGEPA